MPTRMVWTSSSLKLFRDCRRKFFWKYIAGLRTKGGDASLLIGRAFHQGLESWWKSPRSKMWLIATKLAKELEEQIQIHAGSFDQDQLDKLLTQVESFVGMLVGYASHYKNDRSKWKVGRNDVEREFRVDMGDFDYAGKIDMLPTINGVKAVVDHKTASVVTASYLQRLALDTQMRGYLLGAGVGLQLPVKLVVYDVVKKCKLRRKSNEELTDFHARIAQDYQDRPEFYFHREELRFSKADVLAFIHELRQTHFEFIHVVTSSEFGPLDPRTWGINDQRCNDYFRMCEFHELCTTGLDVGTSLLYRRADQLHEELMEV